MSSVDLTLVLVLLLFRAVARAERGLALA